MEYEFEVLVYRTYGEMIMFNVKIDLTGQEVERIKGLIAKYEAEREEEDTYEDFVPEPSLLQILEDGDEELFDKFWWDNIYRQVFVKMLVDGIENGYIEKYPEDDFDYDNEDDFDDIQDMYSDAFGFIDLEHSSCCLCGIPVEWKKPVPEFCLSHNR